LNVFVVPAANEVLAHVNTQWFDDVEAELPVPLSGLKVAPEGTASFVQWTPLGTSNATVKPVVLPGPLFFTEIVPQKLGPSYAFCVTEKEQAVSSSSMSTESECMRCPHPALPKSESPMNIHPTALPRARIIPSSSGRHASPSMIDPPRERMADKHPHQHKLFETFR
jgi:hypothetical protein